jgi:hypothetical protein
VEEAEVTEEQLQVAEAAPADHHHGGVVITEESLAEHLRGEHGVDLPAELSTGTMQGMHDRFHGEKDAAYD